MYISYISTFQHCGSFNGQGEQSGLVDHFLRFPGDVWSLEPSGAVVVQVGEVKSRFWGCLGWI